MTTLNPNQYAILDAMGIPVWQATENSQRAALDAVHPELTNIALDGQARLPLLGNPDAALLFIGVGLSPDGETPSARLFQAILAAIGVGVEECVILAWQSEYQAKLKTYLKTANITQIVMLGSAVRQDCFEQQSIDQLRHQQQQFSAIDTWVSYHPEELLKQPVNKAALWQDLCHLSRA